MAANDEMLTITCNGQTVGVWQHFSVIRGIEMLPSILEITATERWPSYPAAAVVAPFDPCQVYIGSDLILTGYIDVYAPEIARESHVITIGARSKTEDIVDCSVDTDALAAAQGTWQIISPTIGTAAKLLCAPYSINVVLPDDDPPLNPQYPIAVQPGMTVYHMVEELARVTQMLVWDDANGNLVISRVGKTRGDSLVEGYNVEFGGSRLSGDQRYQTVKVIGQYFFADNSGPHMSFSATATDSQVPRKRLLIVPIDMPGPDGKWVTMRAQWEVARRLGRSRVVRAVVGALRNSKGALWQPNTLSYVQAPSLKIAGEEMIVSQVTWAQGENGSSTTLLCAPPEAFRPAPFTFRPLLTYDASKSGGSVPDNAIAGSP